MYAYSSISKFMTGLADVGGNAHATDLGVVLFRIIKVMAVFKTVFCISGIFSNTNKASPKV